SALYAHYVFKAFDVNCSGAISFRRLRWAFRLYDVDGDGAITRQELAEVCIISRPPGSSHLHSAARVCTSASAGPSDCTTWTAMAPSPGRSWQRSVSSAALQGPAISTLLRGSVYERLRWAFRLYDVDGDGAITRQELAEVCIISRPPGSSHLHSAARVVVAVHELLGRRAPPGSPAARVEKVFRKLDLNQDGVITIEEFLESCLKDEVITCSLQMFDTGL
ncbi:Uncharacterized protein OBRU01_22249, partial [Operophtera brumata]